MPITRDLFLNERDVFRATKQKTRRNKRDCLDQWGSKRKKQNLVWLRMWARITHVDPGFVFVPVTTAAPARTAQVLRVFIIIKLVKITKEQKLNTGYPIWISCWEHGVNEPYENRFALLACLQNGFDIITLWHYYARERNKQCRNHTQRFVARKPSTVRPLECCFLWLPCLRERVLLRD